MRLLMLVSFAALVGSCAHPSRQQVWWHEYGRIHQCRVVLAREVETINRRGYVREHAQTCYLCPGSPTEYCFSGPPVGPPATQAPPPAPAPIPGAPPPSMAPPPPPPPGAPPPGY